MDILYIDESGNTGAKDDAVQRKECVCGVLICDTRYRKCLEEIKSFLDDKKIPEDVEIKGYDLFHGAGYWQEEKPSERVNFCVRLAELLEKSGVKFFIILTDKSEGEDPYLGCLKKIIDKVARIVSVRGTTNRQLLLICDERKDLSAQIIKACNEQRRVLIKKYKKSFVFIDSGFESDSRNCLLLQVADFVAYFYRRQQNLIRDNELFKKADNPEVVKALDSIVSPLKNKIILIK